MHNNVPLIEKYRQFLPLTEKTPVVSLGEGFTPIPMAKNLVKTIGFPKLRLYFKLEGLNPTGSFKDRGMTMAMSKAVEENSRAVICASTGNTSASAAAFAAKAGLKCYVVLPANYVALGKLAQALMCGATVVPIEGNFDEALELVRSVAGQLGLTIVNSINPYRLEGQKTAAFEVVEQLGEAPDYLCIPVGNAGNISAYWRGFKQWHSLKRASKRPRMFGFEAAGAAAIVTGKPVQHPETVATAIRIGNPASWQEAIAATEESNGAVDSVTDEEILSAYSLIAKNEGIFCEPASAASFAGLLKKLKSGIVRGDETVVCVLTGNGLKDPDTALKVCHTEIKSVKADLGSLKEAMRL